LLPFHLMVPKNWSQKNWRPNPPMVAELSQCLQDYSPQKIQGSCWRRSIHGQK
jgi:hypothetical protein